MDETIGVVGARDDWGRWVESGTYEVGFGGLDELLFGGVSKCRV